MPSLTSRKLVTGGRGEVFGPVLLGLVVAVPFTVPLSVAGKEYEVGLFFVYLLLFAYLFSLRIFLHRRTRIPRNRFTMLIFLLMFTNILAWLIAGIGGYATMSGFFSLMYWICLISFYFIGVIVARSEKRLMFFTSSVITTSSLVSVFAILYWQTQTGSSPFVPSDVLYTRHIVREVIISWPNYYGIFLSLNLALIVGILSDQKKPASRLMLLGLSLPMIVALLLTVSISALVGLAVSMFTITALIKMGHRKGAVVGFVMLLILSFAFVPTILQRVRGRLERGLYSESERGRLTIRGIEHWLRSPVVGYGFQTYSDLIPGVYLRLPRTTKYIETASAHNEYVTILLKSGLLGLAPFLILVVYVLKKSVQLLHMLEFGTSRGVILGMIAVIVALLVGGFAHDTFHFFPASALFWIYTGALSALTQKAAKSRGQVTQGC